MISRSLAVLIASLLVDSSDSFAPRNVATTAPFSKTSLLMAGPEWAEETSVVLTEKKSLDISKTIYTSSLKNPKDAYIAFAEKGAAAAKMSKHKIFHQSLLGGAYVGFGGLLALTISGNLGGIEVMNPGIPKMVFASLFPVTLLLCVCTGGQLFTSNTATVASAKYEGLVEWREVFKSLTMSLLGNLVGCFLFACAANYVGLLSGGTSARCSTAAIRKCSSPFALTIVKAMLCNWMVTIAVFLSGAANDLTGKLIGCWFPISAFVGIGLEHAITNMFIFPAAYLAGAPLTLSGVILRNLIPAVVGNVIAGSILVAGSYSYQFGNLGKVRREIFQARLAKYETMVALKKKEREARREAAKMNNTKTRNPIEQIANVIF